MKTKAQFMKKLFSILLALVMTVGVLPMTAYAIVDGEGWYIDDEGILFVTGKLTSLPKYSYVSINIVSSGELAFSESEIWKYAVLNSGTISGGTFQGAVENYGVISGGVFKGTTVNSGTISGGTFQTDVQNYGKIAGGTFQKAIENTPRGRIPDGLFLGTVVNAGDVSGGVFQESFQNEYDGTVRGGTFRGVVTNNFVIFDGTFLSLVMNNGSIFGGSFQNGVGNGSAGTIDGGTFSFFVTNNGAIVKAKFLGAYVMEKNPQSVIHNVNGEDKPLVYGNDLLGELGEVQEGTAWYAGDTCVSGGTVPLHYTEYTLKAHSHNYIYVGSDNALTETCANGCGHNLTAYLQLKDGADLTYTGSTIEPMEIVYPNGWQGAQIQPVSANYTNNKNPGTAICTVSYANSATVTNTFKIATADIKNAVVILESNNFIYNGKSQKPEVTVTFNGDILAAGVDYEIYYMSSDDVHKWNGEKPEKFFGKTQSDSVKAGQYYAVVYGMGKFTESGSFAYSAYTIEPKEIDISWGNTVFVYDGTEKFPEYIVGGIIDGDVVQMTHTGGATNAGYGYSGAISGIAGEDAGNYKLPSNSNQNFSILKADQSAPAGIGKTDETVSKKADGTITGVDATMEYRMEGENNYSAITGSAIENLAAGKYYVRIKGDSNHNASPDTAVTIAAGRKFKITLPKNTVGYTVTTTAEEADYGGTFTVTLTVHEGYSKTDSFKFLSNGVDLTDSHSVDGKTFTLNDLVDDVTITVEGIKDITQPTAEIILGTNRWNSFLNTVTFGIFFKDTQAVTVDTLDNGSGIDKTYYYMNSESLDKEDMKDITDWTVYTGAFNINPDNKYIIYVKTVDKAGNITYISSDGLVLDGTGPVVLGMENGGKYHGINVFSVADELSEIVSIKIDGVDTNFSPAQPTVYIQPDNQQHTVEVADQAGNTTTYTITVYKIYRVTFTTENDGGGYEKDFKYGDVVKIPTNEIFEDTFRKSGYTLTGWQGYTEGMTMPLENLTFTAVYTPNNYTVAFNPNGGEAIDPITVTFGEKYGTLPSSAITGLSGGNKNWYLVDKYGSVTETNVRNLTLVATARAHTLFIKRSVLVPNIRIALTVPGGISDGYQYYIPGASKRVLTATVGNMNTDILDYTYQWYKDGTPVDGATANVLTLDGNVSDSGTYQVEVTATLKDGTNIVVNSDTATGSKEQKVKILHAANTLNYDANGGEDGPQSSYTGGTSLNVSKDVPNREYYNFVGWNTRPDGTGNGYKAEDVYTFADDNGNGGCIVTLYAQWKLVEYTVTYKADGKTISTEKVEHGKDADLPAVPVKDGYVGKWDADGKNIDGDTTISAVYMAIPVVDPNEVKPEDKTELVDTKAKLEEELKDDSYNEDDRKDIQGAIDNIDAALEVIGNVEEVEKLIDKLPDTVKKDDEAAIKAADGAYNALTDYEKSLVGEDAKKALAKAKADLLEMSKPTDVHYPATRDNSNLWFWFALLFISGGTVITLTEVNRKKTAKKQSKTR